MRAATCGGVANNDAVGVSKALHAAWELARTFLVEFAARCIAPPDEPHVQDGSIWQLIVQGIAGLSRLQAFNVAG